MRRVALFLATLGGVGYLPLAPGTWGSLAALPLWWVLRHLGATGYLLAWLGVFLVSLWAAGSAWTILGKTDHPAIVLDEAVGMLVALAGAPPRWQWVFLGFVLFRAFDILKPFPIKYLEGLPGGLGVVMDDVAAGVMAWVVLRVALWLSGGAG